MKWHWFNENGFLRGDEIARIRREQIFRTDRKAGRVSQHYSNNDLKAKGILMANESSKQMIRRSADRRFSTRWIVGSGIDIGCGSDPLTKLRDFFPLMTSLKPWDLDDGDAMLMNTEQDETYDFVHSSHCLEHLTDPNVAIENWIRICKPGGHLIITVPDEDMYEQGVWPSTFNYDHKWTFTISKHKSWSPKSISLCGYLEKFADEIEVLKIEKLDSGFVYNSPRIDQTLGPLAESAIEIILKKRRGKTPETGETGKAKKSTKDQLELSKRFLEGVHHQQMGNNLEAIKAYQDILQSQPENLAALNNLSILLPPASAEKSLRIALSIEPNYLDALVNLGLRLLERKQYLEAREVARRALSLSPDNKSAVYIIDKSDAATSENMDVACNTTQSPNSSPETLYTRALDAENSGKTKNAIEFAEQAIAIDNNHINSHILLGRQLLKSGDFQRGAEEIGWIWHGKIHGSQIGAFLDETGNLVPQHGKRVVISADSGIGDSLQLFRYATLLKSTGATVIIECQPEIERLVKSMQGVDEVYVQGRLSGHYDIRVPLHNLIGAFRTCLESIPNTVPYFQPNRFRS
jgi:tetratricopeptide (TPR) repeat protein